MGALILRYFAYVLAALWRWRRAYVAWLARRKGTVFWRTTATRPWRDVGALAALPSADAGRSKPPCPRLRWALSAGRRYVPACCRGRGDPRGRFDGLAIGYGVGMTRYEPVTLADGSVCVLVYQYLPQFASKDLRDALPNPQNLLLGALAVLSVLTLVGIAARAARVILRKMEPLADAVRRIEERDLDFEVASSRVREIDDVLAAMDDMRASLKDSLEAQWRGEQAQREQIAALAHDLKTPLTVVRGNVDLLLEGELSG
ncbi:MAG: histidine kinase dimerization/phospho-acceptor domain-containing protein, partial [Eggerthella lenta]